MEEKFTTKRYVKDGLVIECVYPKKPSTEEDLQKVSNKLYRILLPYFSKENP